MKTNILPAARTRPQSDTLAFPSAGTQPDDLFLFPPGPFTVQPAPLPRPLFNPMFSVGHQLMQARRARDLSIEDVAFETRIPHQRLRDMENDDLSNFANLTYAKGFLKLYSRFLALDLSDFLDEFDTSAISDVTGHEYLQATSAARRPRGPSPAEPLGRGHRIGLAAMTAVLMGCVWVFLHSRAPSDARESAKAPTIKTAPVPPAPPARNTFAKAGTPALEIHPTAEGVTSPVPTLSPAATTPSNVRKATPVDDEGNEIPSLRPAQL